MDKIHITDLSIPCIVGIKSDERVNKQNVLINIILFADLNLACKTDQIDDTIDYKTLKDKIVNFVRDSQFFLIERLAECVSGICLEDKRVQEVIVRIDKPGALTYARTVSVEINRNQK